MNSYPILSPGPLILVQIIKELKNLLKHKFDTLQNVIGMFRKI